MGMLNVGNVEKVISRNKVSAQQVEAMEMIDLAARNLVTAIATYAPECTDRTNAFRHAREARMWANSAIALKGEI
jgi:hypothetical protein